MLKMVDGTGIIGVDMICPLGVSTPQPPNYDRVELEGAGILVLPNSLNALLERLELGGKTEQVTTRGVNLFDASLAKSKENYKDVTINGAIIRAIELDLKPNTKYAFQCVIRSVSTTMNVGNSTIRYVVSDGQKRVITTNEDGKLYVGFTGNVDSEIGKIGVSIVDIQVEEGDTQTAYEPYTGGKPSPSQEYQQEVKNSGKWNEETQKYEVGVKVTGKNLFDYEKAKEKSNWTPCAFNANFAEIAVYVGTGSTVTASNNVKIDNPVYYYGVALKSSEDIKYSICYPGYPSSKDTHTFTATEDYIYVRCNKTSLNEVIGVCGGLQIEIGASRTDFESYKEQTLTITSDRPITKWDRLVEQGGQIGWLYQSEIDADVRPSRIDLFPYGFNLYKNHENGTHTYNVTNIKKAIGFQTSYCKQFKNKDAAYQSAEMWHYSDQPSTKTQYFNTDIPTREEFIEWMESNPLTMVYKTEKTEFVPLPQEEQDAIRALKTYYPTTVITADGGELDPDIKVTYRKEI